jgi:hypothetical protein
MKTVSALLIVCSLVFHVFVFNVLAATAEEEASDDLLQFRSKGHIIGFKEDRMYMVGMGYALTEEFVGANRVKAAAENVSKSSNGLSNLKGAPEFHSVVYSNLWDGITLKYEARDNSLAESTYIIEPNADVEKIRIKYNAEAEIQKNGSLSFKHPTERGYLTMTAPVAWQWIEGKRVKVDVAFNEYEGKAFGFKAGKYDRRYPLTIDPTYEWHTFHGSGYDDQGYGITVDTFGNIYVVGLSYASWGSPISPYSGFTDITVMKLNNSGVLQWNTFLGSANEDFGVALAIDGDGNIYVTGWSDTSWGSPVNAHSGNYDITVLKLNNLGVLQWNTFLGSASIDDGMGIAADMLGNIYVTGESDASWGSPVNAHSGNYDITVLKLNNSGVLQWNTFLGSASEDFGVALAIDAGGNIYVTGGSGASWGSPVNAHSGNYDITVLKLNNLGVLQWHTFLGSSSIDYGMGIAADMLGNIYVTGRSSASWGSPLNSYSGDWDITILKLNNSGVLQWHTFFGSSSRDISISIAVDAGNNIYVTGGSGASWGSPLNHYSGGYDIVVLKLNTNGAYQWHTFYGSSNFDDGEEVAVDGNGNVYVTGLAYATWGSPLNSYSGFHDIIVLKLSDPKAVPTINEWGMIIFMVLAGLGAVYYLRRRTISS